MELYSGYINKLIDELAALPGIGNKSAQRLAFYIIGMSPQRVKHLADTIVNAKEHVTYCKVCQNLTDEDVCPICGNIIQSTGEAVVSCCGIVLPALEAEPEDDAHHLQLEKVEDEYFVTIPHEMSKTHFISFIMAVKDDGSEIRKLYPEGDAEARFKISRTKSFLYYCNQHGLFKVPVR